MSENEFRLVMKGEVVGYEKAHAGEVGKGELHWIYRRDNTKWGEPFIFHDTKDRLVGVFNDVKVWEGDRVKRKQRARPGVVDEGYIIWNDTGQLSGWFFMKEGIDEYRLFNDDNLEVIGRAGKE